MDQYTTYRKIGGGGCSVNGTYVQKFVVVSLEWRWVREEAEDKLNIVSKIVFTKN